MPGHGGHNTQQATVSFVAGLQQAPPGRTECRPPCCSAPPCRPTAWRPWPRWLTTTLVSSGGLKAIRCRQEAIKRLNWPPRWLPSAAGKPYLLLSAPTSCPGWPVPCTCCPSQTDALDTALPCCVACHLAPLLTAVLRLLAVPCRHQGGPDDHRARHHCHPEDRGWPIQEGLARRPRRSFQHHPLLYWCRQGCGQGGPGVRACPPPCLPTCPPAQPPARLPACQQGGSSPARACPGTEGAHRPRSSSAGQGWKAPAA